MTLVLHPHRAIQAAGPACLALAAVGIAAGAVAAVLLVPVGLVLLPALVQRVEVDGRSIRRRGVRGWEDPVGLDSVIVLRLRRIPWPGLERIRRAYRWGRFCSVPLRLRLASAERVVLQLNVVWWSGWSALARYLAMRPTVQSDGRTRIRLERYG
ncbi:MAG: hypothetical protein FJW88_05540 [Actinobacteria bacterium]|nr:hypothetical protein [Actinomycetota bacterium]